MRKTSAVLIVLLTLAQLASLTERALAEPPHTGESWESLWKKFGIFCSDFY
jgi:hypothetical protein